MVTTAIFFSIKPQKYNYFLIINTILKKILQNIQNVCKNLTFCIVYKQKRQPF